MLDPVRRWHHVIVAVAALVTPALVAFGVAGSGMHPERFDAKQVLVVPSGADGVRVREVVDQDFGNASRHGYERIVPNDFGVPIDVVASSPDAPDDLSVVDEGSVTRIRIGDPDVTISDQHRYVLEYTLPEAQLSSGRLELDIIGTDEELETGRFEVVLSGFDLTDPLCHTGSAGAVGGCELVRDGDVSRAVIEPLEPGAGISVEGDIAALTAPAVVPVPDLPERRSFDPLPLMIATLVLGIATAVGGFVLMRRRGRNLVGGFTAADAAFATATGAPARLVTDTELEAMATTEFEAPRGLRPWHGALLLRERIDSDTVSAWFSDQIAQGVVELIDDGDRLVAGPSLDTAPPVTRERVERLLGSDGELQLGKFQSSLQTLWKEIEAEQKVAARESGWWVKHPPGAGGGLTAAAAIVGLMVLAVFGVSWIAGLRHSPVATVIAAVLVPAIAAAVAYRRWLPQRSPTGSAAALQVESFRRFLEASEGQHVEWAWKHGLLREYSAWAVAVGAADAWGRAVAASAVPPPDVAANTMPLLMYTHASSWHSTFTPPSSSGGGSGGFSGGGVGGGGGGGSSGSW